MYRCRVKTKLLFFDKTNILISWRYQLHLAYTTTKCPKNITDAHNPTTKRRRRRRNKNPAIVIKTL
jgi:tRNA uridine 5-carbamoylmethylation protein Kti12